MIEQVYPKEYQKGTRRSRIIFREDVYIVDCFDQNGVVSRTRYLEEQLAEEIAQGWVLN